MPGEGASRDIRGAATLVPGDGNTVLIPVDRAGNVYANDYMYYDAGGTRQSVRDQIAAGGGGGGTTNVTAAATFLAAGNIPYATGSGVRSVKDKNTLNFNDTTNTLSVNNISSGSITNSGTIATTDLNATGTVTTNTVDAQTINATNAVISSTGTFNNLNVTNLNTVVQSAGTTSAPNYSLVVASGPSTGKIKLLTAGTNVTMTETDATHVSISAAGGGSVSISPANSTITTSPNPITGTGTIAVNPNLTLTSLSCTGLTSAAGTFPSSTGVSGQILTTNGSGSITWGSGYPYASTGYRRNTSQTATDASKIAFGSLLYTYGNAGLQAPTAASPITDFQINATALYSIPFSVTVAASSNPITFTLSGTGLESAFSSIPKLTAPTASVDVTYSTVWIVRLNSPNTNVVSVVASIPALTSVTIVDASIQFEYLHVPV